MLQTNLYAAKSETTAMTFALNQASEQYGELRDKGLAYFQSHG